jgi:transcriptional regulator with XRE-family HTH domain
MPSAKTSRGGGGVKEIGPRFRVARKRLGLTQTDFCAPLDLSETALSRFETGKRGIQSDKLLALLRIAAERGMNVDGFVLRGQGEPVRAGSESEMLERILKTVEGLRPDEEAPHAAPRRASK